MVLEENKAGMWVIAELMWSPTSPPAEGRAPVEADATLWHAHVTEGHTSSGGDQDMSQIKPSARIVASPLVLLLLLTPLPAAEEAAPAIPQSAAAFERIKNLSGVWRGRSTKGWENRVTIDVIAGGSVVRSTSFDAHPGETMLTLYHMDGDRLMLTHYCVARNQPRMVATRFEDGGNRIAFDFLDATNLPTPGAGHMHSSILRLVDGDRFTSRWTWFQDGEESWMEEIVYERER